MSNEVQQCLFGDSEMSGRTKRVINAHVLAITEELGTLFPNVNSARIATEISGMLVELVAYLRAEQIAHDSADAFCDSVQEMVRKIGGAS